LKCATHLPYQCGGLAQLRLYGHSVAAYTKNQNSIDGCKINKESESKTPFRGWGIKKGRLITSHRYNRLSLLPSGPGEVEQELVV
jgi:hypothetical protein